MHSALDMSSENTSSDFDFAPVLSSFRLPLLLLVLLIGFRSGAEPEVISVSQLRMGMLVTLHVKGGADPEKARTTCGKAFERLGELNHIFSDYDPESELSILCQKAGGGPQSISPELFEVLTQARNLAAWTEGAYDPTAAPVIRLFRNARREQKLPAPEHIEDALKKVGYRHLELDPLQRTARLALPGMRMDLGAIAKGYMADQIIAFLVAQGFPHCAIEAGGDRVYHGDGPDGSGWLVRVPDAGGEREFRVQNQAVSVSGDTQQYLEVDGVRYSHVIDARNGQPLTDRRMCVVVANRGMDSDSLATIGTLLPRRAYETLLKNHFANAPDARVHEIDGREDFPIRVGEHAYSLREIEAWLRSAGPGAFDPEKKLTRRGALFQALNESSDKALEVFHALNHWPPAPRGTGWGWTGYRSLYEKDRPGISGPYTGLLSNDALVGWLDALSDFRKEAERASFPLAPGMSSPSWKRTVLAGLALELNENGLFAQPESNARWEMGFQFHLMRKRIHWLDIANSEGPPENAVAALWPGGPEGAGSRLLRWLLTDPLTFIKPEAAGSVQTRMSVDPLWMATRQDHSHGQNQLRIDPDSSTLLADIGLFTAWRTHEPSYHGTWDGLVIINTLYEANGASVMALIPASLKTPVSAAFNHLETKLSPSAPPETQWDYSGYSLKDMEHWRTLCQEEFSKPGLKALREHVKP